MVLSAEAQRAWLEQWKAAGPALAEQRRNDLRKLTGDNALAASEALLSLPITAPLSPSRRTHSGLVEQQALLNRLRSR
jgi:hypothetical protein